jgi:hypothetical protein
MELTRGFTPTRRSGTERIGNRTKVRVGSPGCTSEDLTIGYVANRGYCSPRDGHLLSRWPVFISKIFMPELQVQ